MITLIAAMDYNRNIGLNGDMPWGNTMKSDLKRFKELTDGHTIIMGRKTFESLPGVLPNRYHMVLSHKKVKTESPFVGVTDNLDKLARIYKHSDDEAFVIGGAQIYEQFMPYADRIYLTKIHAYLEGDTKFPSIVGNWTITQGILHHLDGDKYGSQYVIYDRVWE